MSNDHEQIRALTYEYTFRLDGGDFAGVGELFGAGQLRMVAAGMDPERSAAASGPRPSTRARPSKTENGPMSWVSTRAGGRRTG